MCVLGCSSVSTAVLVPLECTFQGVLGTDTRADRCAVQVNVLGLVTPLEQRVLLDQVPKEAGQAVGLRSSQLPAPATRHPAAVAHFRCINCYERL